MSDDNIFRFGSVQGGKDEVKEDGIPSNNYIVTDMDHQEWYATGFLIFTPHHLAIMRDDGKGAIPVLVLPIGNVRAAELVEDDDEVELPL